MSPSVKYVCNKCLKCEHDALNHVLLINLSMWDSSDFRGRGIAVPASVFQHKMYTSQTVRIYINSKYKLNTYIITRANLLKARFYSYSFYTLLELILWISYGCLVFLCHCARLFICACLVLTCLERADILALVCGV